MDQPPIYDEQDAIAFVCAWSGLAPEVVGPVIEAKGRYLLLCGLMEDEEDTELLLERQAMKAFLPETPGVLDDRERGYLHLRTGVAFRELEAIEQAELAYQDQLDILVWESDAIRDQRLGAPFGNPTEDLS